MVLRTSEDEQLLGKALQALQDYVQIANYFDAHDRVAATFAYLSPLDAAGSDTDAWKCIHVVQLLFRMATQYASSLDTVSLCLSPHL